MKSLKDRVDALLEVGTSHPQKWMPAHGYNEPIVSDSTDSIADSTNWEAEWRKLRNHHVTETEFLFDVVEELRVRLLLAKRRPTPAPTCGCGIPMSLDHGYYGCNVCQTLVSAENAR